MKHYVFALLLLFSTKVFAICGLSEQNEKLYIASNVMLFADWQTTLDMTRYPKGSYDERGIVARALIGPTPGRGAINTYFFTRAVLNHVLACNLSNTNATVYLLLTNMDHGSAVVNNYNIGLRIRF